MDDSSDLLTERLRLRRLRSTDTPFLVDLISDPDVRKYLGGVVPEADRPEVVRRYFLETSGAHKWLVESRVGHLSLGMVFLGPYRDADDLELSYQFSREAWGQGHGGEAAGRVCSYAREVLCLDHLMAETQTANAASCRLLERLGMVEMRRMERFGASQSIYVG